MSRCSICQHPKRAQLELGLILGTSMRVLVARFDCSPDALQRHGQRHLSAVQRAAIMNAQAPTSVDLEALERSESEGLLCQLVAQRARLQAHIELASQIGDARLAIMAESRITQNLALLWQIYSRRCSLQIHFRQCGHCCGGSRATSSRMAWRTAGKVG